MTLPESAQVLLSALKRLADDNGAVQLSAKALAEEAGISVGAVAKAKARLEEEGYIRVEPSPNRYRYPDTIVVLHQAPIQTRNADVVQQPHPKSRPDPPKQQQPEPEPSMTNTNANGRDWLARLFRQTDPSMPPISAEALASADIYQNLAWALEYIHRTLNGREMTMRLTRQIIQAMCREVAILAGEKTQHTTEV